MKKFWLATALAAALLQGCGTPPAPAARLSATAMPRAAEAPVVLPAEPVDATAVAADAAANDAVKADSRALCDGRAEGDRIQVAGRGGEAVVGRCVRAANGWLHFMPEAQR